MEYQVTRAVMQALREEFARAFPEECCGILVGEGDAITAIIPAINVHQDPRTHFEIDPQTLLDTHRDARNGGPAVLGYYHSHPNGPGEPSAIDAAMAAGDGKVWAIICANEISWWIDGADVFTPLPLTSTDG